MKTSDFDYDLPQELIAQTPLLNRSASRLLVLDRKSRKYEDHHFDEIVDYFKAGDVLVRNNTRVIPARLFGTKEETNGHVEMLLLKDLGEDKWECLLGNARIVKLNTVISFGDGLLKAECLEIRDKGVRV
ncbi:MAG: S-adenosylmethionine:tRNA ribosyltransferase-isomerase, partial [Erysipelotrichaceae bacterium]|nr:S-adenosylmethionine:tRNA ribosyltransferase-isomerase [Erysipelotrichaceae bacterium]